MTRLYKLLRILLRFLLVWAVDAISLWVTAMVLPGFALVAREGYTSLTIAVVVALVLGLVNFLIRPIILLVARPFGMVVTFVVGFFVNALALIITAMLLPGLQISGILPAVIGGLVLAAVNTVLTGLLTLDDSDSFYEQRIRRLAQNSPFPDANSGGQGLLVMEIGAYLARRCSGAPTAGLAHAGLAPDLFRRQHCRSGCDRPADDRCCADHANHRPDAGSDAMINLRRDA